MHHLFGSMFTSKSLGDMFVLNKKMWRGDEFSKDTKIANIG